MWVEVKFFEQVWLRLDEAQKTLVMSVTNFEQSHLNCHKKWASFISRFLMDLHQEKWSGKIHIFNYWNQLYKVKHCHLLSVLYSKRPCLGRGRCPVCVLKLILGKASLAFTKSAFYDPKHFSTWEPKAVKLSTSEYVCYLHFINQVKFIPKMQWFWEYFIKTLVL